MRFGDLLLSELYKPLKLLNQERNETMPITIKWDNEDKTIIRVDFVGEWTVDDYNVVNREEEAMLDSVDHKVDIIGVLENITMPKDALANFWRFSATPGYTHPNAGLMVHVVDSRFAKTMVEIFGRVYKQLAEKIVIVSTLEEAYETITEYKRFRRVG